MDLKATEEDNVWGVYTHANAPGASLLMSCPQSRAVETQMTEISRMMGIISTKVCPIHHTFSHPLKLALRTYAPPTADPTPTHSLRSSVSAHVTIIGLVSADPVTLA